MASSSHDSLAQAQLSTPLDSPGQETSPRENKSQLIVNAIRGLLAEPLKMQRPLDDGSEPVTVNQLNGLLEAVLASKGSLSSSGIGHASLEQSSDNTTNGKCLAPPDVFNH